MIVNNTCPNVRIFPYKDAKGIVQHFFMLPGVNGEVPESVADNEMFKEQRELNLMAIIATKKPTPVDPTRMTLKPDRIAVVPDNDVVAAVLEMDEKKALALIPDIVKRATLVVLKAQERRASIIQAIEKQIEDIDKLNLPTRK
jgi:hypothetical protein